MACINMFNPADPIGPRISFSNDFVVDPAPPSRHERVCSDPDFEFSVGGRPMMAADELFFGGRMLPLRGGSGERCRTLFEEMRAEDSDVDEEVCVSGKPPKGSMKWKGFLGLKKPAPNSAAPAGNKNYARESAEDHCGEGEDRAKDQPTVELKM